ncbi:nadh dehydrogenase [Fusarium flagelliforme]|uniref:Nadh dehydrogenase n=1 Tax=Fusarium flagelliforme TaxID=2675880 RepID=A0A395MRF5_9HYPO|nr:nadh dehydrogenase [Fusarium flagelliforme]
MRYKDWDVLLFEQSSPVPLQEFKVGCYAVQDTGPQASGIPIVTCFVPSLVPGTPFQISIHSWKQPSVDQVVDDNCPSIGARLFVDGSLVASTFTNKNISWPCIISHIDAKKAIRFPMFQQVLLRQRHWSAADNLGRIKLVISEGVSHGSEDNKTFEKVHNLVIFSFQHAPQDLLECLEIAWPNPSMWRRLQQSVMASQTSSNSQSTSQHVMQQPLYEFQGQALSEYNNTAHPGTPSFFLTHQSAVECANAQMNATLSPWNHAVPPHIQSTTPHMSTPDVPFRKENCQIPTWPGSPILADPSFTLGHQSQQQVLQQMYTPSNGSVPIPLVRPQSAAVNGSVELGRAPTGNPTRLLFAAPTLDAAKRSAKRARTDTPTSTLTLEEEEEVRKCNSRFSFSPFGMANIPGSLA